jgi:hypothetical protein
MSEFQLKKAARSAAKIRVALMGTSGSGKTYSALLMAYGICGDWNKIALIDTETGSGHLYEHLGAYNVMDLTPDYSPERYVSAIEVCEKAGMEVIVIDSASHEWNGKGGLLEIADKMGTGFQKWMTLTPRHNKFVDKMISSTCHIIATFRTSAEYAITENDKGKKVPEKIGIKPLTREGVEYEFTIAFDINSKNLATVSKDRTSLFVNMPHIITAETGKRIIDWCNSAPPKAEPLPTLTPAFQLNPEQIQALLDLSENKFCIEKGIMFDSMVDKCTSLAETEKLINSTKEWIKKKEAEAAKVVPTATQAQPNPSVPTSTSTIENWMDNPNIPNPTKQIIRSLLNSPFLTQEIKDARVNELKVCSSDKAKEIILEFSKLINQAK